MVKLLNNLFALNFNICENIYLCSGMWFLLPINLNLASIYILYTCVLWLFFSVLFNIVQFRNDPCTISNTETGICYTQDECSNKGGQAKRSCASGFGSCCLCKYLIFFLRSDWFENIDIIFYTEILTKQSCFTFFCTMS